jgi:hypothetical protein
MYENKLAIKQEEKNEKKLGHKEEEQHKNMIKPTQSLTTIYAIHLFVRAINISVYYYLMPLSLVLLNILYAFNYSHL